MQYDVLSWKSLHVQYEKIQHCLRHTFSMQKKTSCEVHDKHYQYYRYFVYFPFDVLNQNISYHVSAEMIPIIDNS